MKIHFNFKSFLPHITAVAIFIVITFSYLTPLLEGKKLLQSDVANYEGMAKEINDFKKETGETALWTNSMFSGMPSYLINLPSKNNIKFLHRILNLNHKKPANYLFIYLIGFYIALLLFGVNPWLSIVGAVAYAFSSYFFIIVEAGHLTKAMALGYMPPIIAGVYHALNKNAILGGMAVAIFLSLQILVNHLQITYYTLLIILIYGIFHLVFLFRNGNIKQIIKPGIVLIIAVILAVGSNFGTLYLTYDYGKDSMRGKSELTHNEENKTAGLDKDYATAWSYGVDETLTLLIPNFKGGASGGSLGKNSETYKVIERNQGVGFARQFIKQLPLYWGSQPFTSGPVYVGAIVMFLFVLGLFLIKGKLKWWIVTATLLSILLAWGKNFMFLTDLFLDYFPGYNKFRTVSMILIIAEFTMPVLAIITIQKIISEQIERKVLLRYLKYSLYIVGGICLFFAIFPGMFFNFSADIDERYIAQGAGFFIDALRDDRKMLLKADAFRSLIFVLIGAGILIAFIYQKINKTLVIVLFGFAILFDMWPVDKRYLNEDDFVSKRKVEEPFTPTAANKLIMKDTAQNFRVYNLAVNTFNDASTSYFHKSIGGYHGAKMKRYQELIDFHISKQNMNVLNMLNTKYFIVPTQKEQQVQVNMDALGNAWFVDDIEIVASADDEIEALNDFNPETTAIVDQRFNDYIENYNFKKDSTSQITLLHYSPNELNYQSDASKNGLVVFSEIYYNKGWNAYIDGKKVPHIRVNYVLRALKVPEGKHIIKFKFEPKAYYYGNLVSNVSSIILIILFLGIILKEILFEKREESMA